MKKYSNDNIFLNDLNDISRSAYSNKTKNDIPLKNNAFERFETDLILNHKEEFETNNNRINSLNDEISELKNKLKLVQEKDEEIYKLKCEIQKLESRCQENNKLQTENIRLQNDFKRMKDENDKLQLESLNNESLVTENNLLKQKLVTLVKNEDKSDLIKETLDVQETIDAIQKIDIKEEEIKKEIKKEKIQLDVIKLKQVLYNRLKTYHEKHIDNLISQYDLQMKDSIDKETMEKILLEAIHI